MHEELLGVFIFGPETVRWSSVTSPADCHRLHRNYVEL